MQLVVLPGLDGTGRLLTDFTDAALPFFSSVSVVRYPTDRVLDYAALEQFVRRRLPVDAPFVLLGESFSGPLAIAIAADAPARLRGVVLSTTFDHQPVPQLARLSPLTTIAPAHWLPPFLLSWALLGSWATPALQNAVTRALRDVSSVVLRERARQAMLIDVRDRVPRISVPLLYLRGTSDRLLEAHAGPRIVRRVQHGRLVDIAGPHLLLQAQSTLCAEAVGAFAGELAGRAPTD